MHLIHLSTPLELRRLQPDIVVSGELGARSLLRAGYCLVARRPPLVIGATLSERTEQGRGTVRIIARRLLLRRAARVLVNGESGARYIRRFGVSDRAIDRVPQPALPGFEEAGTTSRPRVAIRHLIYAGQITELKGLIPFIHALDDWSRHHPTERVTLTVAGSGPLSPALDRLATTTSLEIRMVGECDPEKLIELYSQADAFVFPTLADEWGQVVNAALAAGPPCWAASTARPSMSSARTDESDGCSIRRTHSRCEPRSTVRLAPTRTTLPRCARSR